jgi:hypothetical protein
MGWVLNLGMEHQVSPKRRSKLIVLYGVKTCNPII